MNRNLAWLIGIFVYLVALLVMAPATLIARLVQQQTEGHLVLTATTGKVWSGQGSLLVQGNAPEDQAAIGPLRWDILPLQLLLGRLQAAVVVNGAAPLWLTLDASRLHVEHLDVEVPVAAIGQFSPNFRAVRMGGKLTIRGNDLSYAQGMLQGELIMDWSGVTSALSHVNPLGNYRFTLNDDANGIKVTLVTVSGPLQLQGSGSIRVGQGLTFAGEAHADPDQRQALAEFLRIIGDEQPLGSGSHRLALTGS